ncbi:fibulin-2-like isoform X2 [Pectinophora gossypiella]|uniref:fibulin-2-like isoform X2 n=1 Tax=Pectinophora gossypiella TaxID=13191 RepID=UPI00214F1CA0|nr:fibulin-2-like isoform X2 [Pectinophora gossypiella]
MLWCVLCILGVTSLGSRVHGSLADLMTETTNLCCNKGSEYARTHSSEDCTSAIPPDVPSALGSLCIFAMDQCCKEYFQKKRDCDAGVDISTSSQTCDSATESAKSCCEECGRGKEVGWSRGEAGCEAGDRGTAAEDVLAGSAFEQCCKNAAREGKEKEDREGQNHPATNKNTKPKTAAKPATGSAVASLCEEYAPNELCAHHCIPVPGSYKCECNPGYMLMADGRNCKEVVKNRCKPKNPCQHKCNDNGVEVKCSCRRGYQLMADGKSCEDIDECKLDPPVCLPSTQCYNIQGSYKCIPKKNNNQEKGQCPSGFIRNVKNNACDDINECTQPNPPCPSYLCENTVGGYKCGGVLGDPANLNNNNRPIVDDRCPPGFRMGGNEECEDVDECALRKDDCNPLSQFCINTRGSFYCQNQASKHCPPGFKIDPRTNKCEDIDECEDGQDICRHDQICVNVPGEYDCKPKDDYRRRQGNKCPEGMRMKPGTHICEDIDECAEGTHLCDLHQNCLNTNGSHECRCKLGFEIDHITGGCVDVNECATSAHNCIPGSQRCDNTVGSFLCIRFTSCGTGYILQASTSQCEDVDECALGTHNCAFAGPEYQCENHPGSFRCVRKHHSTTSTTPAPEYEYEYYDSEEEVETNQTKPTEPQPQPKPEQVSTTTTIKPTEPPTTPSQPPMEPIPIPLDREDHPKNDRHEPETPQIDSSFQQPESERPGYRQPESEQPGYRQPESEQPGYRQPESEQPSFRQPESEQPGFKQPESEQPNYQQPESEQPGHRQPESEQPGYRQPESEQSGYRQPDSEQPEYKQPESEQPGFKQPDSEQPDYRQPESPPEPPSYNHYDTTEQQKPDATPRETNESLQPDSRQPEQPSPTPPQVVFVDVGKETATVRGEKKEDGSVVVDTKNLPKNEWTKVNEKPTNCQVGFEMDDYGACYDIDECATNRHSCSGLTETCRNTMGGYLCECAAGFRRDLVTGACDVITTSSTTTPAPPPSPTAPTKNRPYFWGYPDYRPITTRPFRPRTLCDVGYHLNSQTGKCEDINECTNGQANCATVEICVNTEGGYRCECPPNWVLDDVRHRCVPVRTSGQFPTGYGNEPGRPPSPSDVQKTFKGTKYVDPEVTQLGGSRSVMSCPVGYKLGYDNTCEDIDECSTGQASCGGMLCTNLPGGYVCSCPQGHKLVDGNRCEDVDECSMGGNMPICSQNADCVNTVGSYQCKCHTGFRSAPVNEKVCVDVDECMESPSGSLCQHRCNNVWGGYRCTCHRGYRLNPDNSTCSDVDECTEFKSKIPCVGRCVNEPGSYRCICPQGYRLSEDKRSCIDIDECETGEAMCAKTGTYGGTSDVCLNTRGGYRCHSVACPPGYKLEGRHRCTRIEKICPPSDWDCAHQPTTYSYNFITFVSKLYIPDSKVDLFTMRGPAWPNAKMRFQLRLVNVNAPPTVKDRADINAFLLVHTNNQAVMSLVRSLEGPQSIELELSMELYNGEQFGGIAVAKLYIYVSEYEF